MIGNHGLFLEWLSESGAGSWSEFARAHEWAFPSMAGQRRNSPYWTAGAYASLGHLEVDWTEGRWAVTPPVITILPGGGEHAILVGSRTRFLMHELLAASSEEVTQDLEPRIVEQPGAPAAVFIAGTSEAHLAQLALDLGIQFEHSVSDSLTAVLQPITANLVAISPPPATSTEIERWDPADCLWKTSPIGFGAGLYRYRSSGLRRYRFFRSASECFSVDFPAGAYAELARVGRTVMGYAREEVNGTLTVNARAPLPTIQARAAALCSGIAPEYDAVTTRLRYPNVPVRIARAIAESLLQDLPVAPKE